MKVVVIGASGLVGSYLVTACQNREWDVIGTYHRFAQPGLLPLQLTDKEAVQSFINNSQPQVIFLPAFLSNVDYCEQNPEETYNINVIGSGNVIEMAKKVRAKLVFYSSDYVFNGESGPYRETDTPAPICVYGRQKLEIEEKIASTLENFLILRITVVYGWEMQGKNFVSRLIKSLKDNQPVKVPQDQIGSPTLVNDIAAASCRLVEAEVTGIFHTAGVDCISRYDFALEVARIFELPTDNIIPVITTELQQPASRPLKAGMISDKLTNILKWNLHGTKEGLIYLKQIQAK